MNMAAQSRPNQLFAAGPKQRPETGQQVDAAPHAMGAAAPPPPMFGAPPRGMPNGTHMPPPPSPWPPARPPPPTFMQPPPMAQPSGPPPGMGPPPQQQQMGAPPMAGQPPPWMAPPGVLWHDGFSRPPWLPCATAALRNLMFGLLSRRHALDGWRTPWLPARRTTHWSATTWLPAAQQATAGLYAAAWGPLDAAPGHAIAARAMLAPSASGCSRALWLHLALEPVQYPVGC